MDTEGRAVPRAAVRLIGDSIIETVLTDSRGRFFFKSMPPGEAVVTAQKFGYFDGAYGKRRANGQPLPFSLGAGQVMPDLRIEIFRAGVITGSVVDEVGEPILGARVIAMRRQFGPGGWQYVEAAGDATDDEGRYRIYGLQPGEYIVSTPSTTFSVPAAMANAVGATGTVSVGFGAVMLAGTPDTAGQARAMFLEARAGATSDGRDLVWTTGAMPPDDDGAGGMYPVQFYPSTDHRILALPIALAPGEVRYAVDFHLPLVPARRVIGRLVGEPRAVAHQIVRLMPHDALSSPGDEVAVTTSENDGTFRFVRVPRGRYRLEAGNWGTTIHSAAATMPAPNVEASMPKAFWASAPVEVEDVDVTMPGVPMRDTAIVSGRVEMEGANPDRIRITIEPARPGLSLSAALRVTPDGDFAASNVVPGEYFIRVGALPPGWFLKSITAGGRDVMDDPIDVGESGASVAVTLTTRGTEIIGSVRDARMQATAGAAVIILPVTARGDAVWTPNRTRETRTSTNGVFIVSGLPPGDYLIVAIDDAAAEGWQDSRVLATLRTLATRIRLRDAESRTLQLRMSAFRR